MAGRYLFHRISGKTVDGPSLLRETFERLSGSFLKFGQILALQIDTLPREYCDALLSLLDRVPPISQEEVDSVFIDELGESARTILPEFDYRPIASASIGQVHRARMEDGTLVAVKVQRPGIRAAFDRDLSLLTLMVRGILFFRIRSLYFMLDPVRELRTWTRDELDYRSEAAYCMVLRENATHTPTERIPQVFWDLTTRRILTMEFLEGPSVADYLRMQQQSDYAGIEALRQRGFVPAQFSANIISNFLSDAFQFGVFHADLHPANLLILPNNVVGYVDFGIVATLTNEARRKQIELTMAYASGSPEAIYRQFLNICTVRSDSDLAGMRSEIANLAKEWYREPPIAGSVRFRVSITRTMMDLLAVCRHHGVVVDREVIKYIRSTILADGLIARLEPGFDMARILRTVVEKHAIEESYSKIFSTAGALSMLSDLVVWLESTPRDFLRALSMLERRQLRMRTTLSVSTHQNSPEHTRLTHVTAIWALSILSLAGGGLPSFRVSPFLAVLDTAFVTLWSLWLVRLLFRLRTRDKG
jgi:ubiquinone biosynthesis protein